MATEITGRKVAFKIASKTFGCASTITFSTKRAMIAVPCQANGGFNKQIPGAESWDGNFTAVMRVFETAELATNVTLREMYTALREGTLLDVEYEIDGVEDYVFTSKAYLTNVDFSVPDSDGLVTWTGGLVGAEPLLLGI